MTLVGGRFVYLILFVLSPRSIFLQNEAEI